MRVKTILGDYLQQAGVLTPVKLGDPARIITVTEEERRALIERLLKQSRFNNLMVIVVTVMHIALFVLASVLVYYYRESFNKVAAILGGSVISLLAITRSLTSLWREKWMTDILITALPNLTAKQALDFVKTLYYAQHSARPDHPNPQQTPPGR